MAQDHINNLPSEIIIDILSRLPVPTIIHCKDVCKSWLNLLETREFVKTHLSKSVPGLAIRQRQCSARDSITCRIFEFKDSLDLKHHELHYNPIIEFDLPHPISCPIPCNIRGQVLIEGSANGLFLVRNMWSRYETLFVYNPVTRDYIELDCPLYFHHENPQVVNYGFGVSKMSGQHKVVRIFNDVIRDEETRKLLRISKYECQIYTLGTGLWRRIETGVPLGYNCPTYNWPTSGAFLNGNLHWSVCDLNGSKWISCFDLETEVFSTFSTPSLGGHIELWASLSVLADCLCLCDNSSYGETTIIWLMKEYGHEKSWTKESVIKKNPFKVVYPMKLFKDGDILMAALLKFPVFHYSEIPFCYSKIPFYYSIKSQTINNIYMLRSVNMFVLIEDDTWNAILHTLSFLSLKSFANENVRSF